MSSDFENAAPIPQSTPQLTPSISPSVTSNRPNSLWRRLRRFLRGTDEPPSYFLTRWLFLRLLGFVYLFAFTSFWLQALGLVGSQGILPVSDFVGYVRQALGNGAFWRVPTLFLFNSSDAFLLFLSAAGTGLSVLVILDVLTGPALLLLWLLYLSIVYGGQDFMSFQWDILLLEAGFLAIFFAQWRLVPRLSGQSKPSIAILWLLRWLLFRLMFESGYSKLASGDPTWRNLTAMTYHYQTQPLPTPAAWYFYWLPLQFHQLETLFTFLAELIMPFLIFAPRRLRMLSAGFMAGLQLLIMLTGNYTFFNILTIVLCVTLLDDPFLRRFMPQRLTERLLTNVRTSVPAMRRVVVGLVTVLIVFLTGIQVIELALPKVDIPQSVLSLAESTDSFRIANTYGLFATMTTARYEIFIEGSNDSQNWVPYNFRFKPGDPAQPPRFVEPFQPRLDWQMWFEALRPLYGYGASQPSSWFLSFIARLLKGSPDVLGLLADNPFPDAPPHYIRATLYRYEYTDSAERAATGNWWKRTEQGLYLPPISVEDLNAVTR